MLFEILGEGLKAAICRIMENKIAFGLLPAAMFMNGESFFIQKSHDVLGFEPYIVHASYVAGKLAKRERFREAGLWQVRITHCSHSMLPYPLKKAARKTSSRPHCQSFCMNYGMKIWKICETEIDFEIVENVCGKLRWKVMEPNFWLSKILPQFLHLVPTKVGLELRFDCAGEDWEYTSRPEFDLFGAGSTSKPFEPRWASRKYVS